MKYLLLAVSIALAAECYSSLDLKNNTCNTLCRRDDYDIGYFEQKSDSCVCAHKFKWSEYTKKAIRIYGQSSLGY